MGLVSTQNEFAANVAKLIQHAHALGYQITLGELYRPPILADIYAKKGIGIRNSVHCVKLAIDVALFKDGEYLTDSKDYAELHAYWQDLGGAPAIPGDGNHFSMGYQGRR
jgi:hypothetical protein